MIRGYLHGEPRFLSTDEVLTLHETAIDAFGGSHGVRDAGSLNPHWHNLAKHLAENTFTISHLEWRRRISFIFSLITRLPTVTIRTALATCIAFLRLNGWNLVVLEDTAYEKVLDIAQSLKTKKEIEEWLLRNTKPRPSLELREFFRRLNYKTIAAVVEGIAAGDTRERVATILEASQAIPAITQANIGAMSTDEEGSRILHQHTTLLTAIYRIAEEMGYEW